jgi:hypothetical protein
MKYSNFALVLLPLIVSALPSKRDQPSALGILNFALNLEHIENAYYHDRLAKYSQEDFLKAGYPASVYGRFKQIALHEKTHVEFLSSAIAAAGGKVAKPCEYKFPDNSVTSFIKLSEDFETVGTSAYNGALGPLSDTSKSQYVTVAGSILAIEAQQAAWINSAVLKSYPWSTSFNTPLTANEAFTIASGFIVKCPSDNPPLIAHSYPTLTVSPTAPGAVAKLSFDNHGKPSFAAFVAGTGTSFVPINDKGEVTVPEGLIGTVYVLVTKNTDTLTDETIVAGPALVRFPYPSDA